MSIEELLPKETSAIEDLVVEQETSKSKLPHKSASNLAAKAAMLTENPLEGYQAAKAEMDIEGTTNIAAGMIESARTNTLEQSKEVLFDLVANPDIPEEVKTEATKSFYAGQAPLLSSEELIAGEALIAPVQEESYEGEAVRASAAEILKGEVAYKKRAQAIHNEHLANMSLPMTEGIVDMIETFFVPAVNNIQTKNQLDGMLSYLNQESSSPANLFLVGDSIKGIRTLLENMPVEDREPLAVKMSEILAEADNQILGDENIILKMDLLDAILSPDGYTSTDQFIDNVLGVLEMIPVVGAAVRLGKGAGVVKDVVENRNASMKATVDSADPSSPAEAVSANPEKTRDLHTAVSQDETGELAEVINGTDRTDAIAHDVLPQPATVDGSVQYKTIEADRNESKQPHPDPVTIEKAKANSKIHYTPVERDSATAVVKNNFRDVNGLTYHNELSQFTNTGAGLTVRAVYGKTEGGFRYAEDLAEQTKMVLRDYGVQDKDLKILQRTENGYERVALKDVKGKEGDYLVQVDYDYEINASDVTAWEKMDVRNNLFGRLPVFNSVNFGSIQRHIVDAASMFQKEIYLGASHAKDRVAAVEKSLMDLNNDFTKTFNSLSKNKQAALYEEIKRANKEGVPFDIIDLKARGMDDVQIEAIQKWRTAWDTIYHLENADLVRSTKARGFKLFENSKTQLVAKPVPKGAGQSVYDPDTDTIREVVGQEAKDLYDNGGTIAVLRNPIEIDGETVTHILAKGGPDSGLRGITEEDRLLQYRPGYYSVHYTAPKYIEKIVRDDKGKELYRKAVAVAGSTKEAAQIRNRMMNNEGLMEEDFVIRGDTKLKGEQGDTNWELQVAKGRSSQRVRGERLEGADAPINNGLGDMYMSSPEEALQRSIVSISNRAPMRDYLEGSKKRFLAQYGPLITNRDDFGQPKWPDRLEQITKKGSLTDAEVADARQVFEYITSMENGYINSLDDGFKYALQTTADVLGNVSSTAERALGTVADVTRPTSLAKNTAFQVYIAGNLQRQAVVQSHQSVRLSFLDPVYSLKIPSDVSAYVVASAFGDVKKGARMMGVSEKEMKDIVKFVEASGQLDAVNKHNLIRSSQLFIADTSAKKVARAAGAPLRASQKVGFELGEQYNILSSLLMHRHLAKKEGKDIKDGNVMAEAAALSRNFTYGMNAAGDMPYNQNALGIITQFMQVPHKAVLQYINRQIPLKQRMKLATLDSLMWGAPTAAVVGIVSSIENETGEKIPEPFRDGLINGFEGVALNKSLSMMAGEEVSVDWAGFAPADLHGMSETVHLLFTEPMNAIANSPSGKLFVGNNPRVTNAMKDVMSFFGQPENYTDVKEISKVAKSAAGVFSGFNNWFKSEYAKETRTIVNANKTSVYDDDVNAMEASLLAFGFPTKEMTNQIKASRSQRQQRKDYEEAFNDWFREYSRQMSRDDLSITEIDGIVKINAEAHRVFGKNRLLYQELLNKKLRQATRDGNFTFYKNAFKVMGVQDKASFLYDVRQSTMSEKQKELIIDMTERVYKEE